MAWTEASFTHSYENTVWWNQEVLGHGLASGSMGTCFQVERPISAVWARSVWQPPGWCTHSPITIVVFFFFMALEFCRKGMFIAFPRERHCYPGTWCWNWGANNQELLGSLNAVLSLPLTHFRHSWARTLYILFVSVLYWRGKCLREFKPWPGKVDLRVGQGVGAGGGGGKGWKGPFWLGCSPTFMSNVGRASRSGFGMWRMGSRVGKISSFPPKCHPITPEKPIWPVWHWSIWALWVGCWAWEAAEVVKAAVALMWCLMWLRSRYTVFLLVTKVYCLKNTTGLLKAL